MPSASNTTTLHVERVLPRTGAGTLTAPEAHAILGIAFLAGEADGHIADEEQEAFSNVAQALRGLVGETDARMTEDALEKLLAQLGEDLGASGRAKILERLMPRLERELVRDLAYKVAFAMSISDLDRSDEESDFDAELIEMLGLTEEQADILAGDVYAALEEAEVD